MHVDVDADRSVTMVGTGLHVNRLAKDDEHLALGSML